MDTTLELKVYKNYRAALKARMGGHAAQRRQAARKATVERYNVSYRDLKNIITKFDALNNTTHEHPADYLHKLEYEEANRQFAANPVSCQCGSTDMVRVRVNPYEAEINNKFVLMTSCYMCWLVRSITYDN